MSKKGKTTITALIIFILILTSIFSTMIFLSHIQTRNKILKLNQAISINAKIFYLTDANYPEDPKEVLEAYLEGYGLIYNNVIEDEDFVSFLLDKQRKLLSESVLSLNTPAKQLKNVLKSLEVLKEAEFKIVDMEVGEMNYITNKQDKGEIDVLKIGNDGQEYNFKYYLQKDQKGKWKIYRWENSSNNFQIKIDDK